MPDIEYLVEHHPRSKKRPFSVTAIVRENGDGSNVRFVTTSPNLALKSINGFPSLNLKKDDLAPVRHVKRFAKPKVNWKIKDPKVILFEVYYSGPIANFYGGKLDRSGAFQPYRPLCTVSFPGRGY